MSSPLSIKPKKEHTACCLCFTKPKKKHAETKEKIEDLHIPALLDAEKLRQMSDSEIADLFTPKHRRVPTTYPRDEKK